MSQETQQALRDAEINMLMVQSTFYDTMDFDQAADLAREIEEDSRLRAFVRKKGGPKLHYLVEVWLRKDRIATARNWYSWKSIEQAWKDL